MTSLVRRNKHHPDSADPRINRPARPQAAAACDRRHGQPGGSSNLGHYGPWRDLPGAGAGLGSCLRRASRSARYRAKRLRGPCEVMANRSDRGREQPAVMSRAPKPAKQNGTSSAETIRASGHDRANRPYTRLHPTNAPNPHKSLATREPSTCGASTFIRSAGTVQTLRPRSNSDQLASATSLFVDQ